MTETEPAARADEDVDWHNGQGEAPDNSAMTALHLAHRAVHKFPELTKRYQKFIGTAAVVSTAVIVLASIAVSRRMSSGQSAGQILAEITTEEIENAGKVKPAKPKSGGKDKGRFLH